MKKLMMTAAVLAAGIAIADNAIVSSDIVGYANNSSGLKDSMEAMGVGSMFLTVDSSDATLGDIHIVGYAPEMGGETGVYCQFLDGAGRTTGIDYFWYDFGTKGVGEELVDWAYGWYDGDGTVCYNSTPLKAGEGVWMFSPSTAYSVQSSGAVAKAPVAVTLRSSMEAKMVVNPMPSDLTFGDMWISGYAPELGGETGVYCQLLDGAGRTLGIDYFWYDFGTKGSGVELTDWAYGWYDGDGTVSYNDTALPAGEGVWMFSPSTSYKVNFKSPLN